MPRARDIARVRSVHLHTACARPCGPPCAWQFQVQPLSITREIFLPLPFLSHNNNKKKNRQQAETTLTRSGQPFLSQVTMGV